MPTSVVAVHMPITACAAPPARMESSKVMTNDGETRELRTACPTCGGRGHIHEPKLAILGGEAQTVLAPRSCTQCGDFEEPGWLAGFAESL